MVTDAKKVGEIFRHKREEKQLSFKEIESATSIRAGYLQAIEDGNMEKFLSTVYMYGFMRQYAQFLGLDVERMTKDHPEVFRSSEQKKHDFLYGIGSLETKGSSSTVPWSNNLMWIGGAAATLLLAWWFAKFLGLMS